MKYQRIIILILSIQLCLITPSNASTVFYKEETHTLLTTLAYRRSTWSQRDNKRISGLFEALGIQDQFLTRLPNWQGDERTVVELLRDGAVLEDDGQRPVNHFFNPRTGQGTSVGNPSPTWILEDQFDINGQEFSYGVARKSLLKGLVSENETERKKALGRMIQSLGNILHHLQDMAQPQHSRVDSHLDGRVLGLPFEISELLAASRQRPSHVEYYTNQKYNYGRYWYDFGKQKVFVAGNSSLAEDIENVAEELRLDLAPYAYGEGISIDTLIEAGKLTKPRDFWQTTEFDPNPGATGFGIAEFANRNFFTAGTLPGDSSLTSDKLTYPASSGFNKTEEEVSDLLRKGKFPADNFSGVMTFYSTDVIDILLPNKSDINRRALAESFLSEYLEKKGESPLYVLNRLTYDEGQQYLLPRAIAYSAWMLDYFFRGELKVTNAPGKTSTIKIQNPRKEALEGTFTVYYDDKDGKRKKLPGAEWTNKLAAFDPANPDDGLEFSLTPPSDVDPKNAGKYLLVFKGSMGDEKPGGSCRPGDESPNCQPGAVVFTQFSTECPNALYLRGVNALNQEIYFKTDCQGTREIKADEFTPFTKLPEATSLNVYKQTDFQGANDSSSYQVSSFGVPLSNGTTFFYRDRKDNSWQTRQYGAGHTPWRAISPDPKIGEFFFNLSPTGEGMSISWERRFLNQNNQMDVEVGFKLIPPITIENESVPFKLAQNKVEIPYLVVPSGDGKRLAGFLFHGKQQTINGPGANVKKTTKWYQVDVQIGLGVSPTITPVVRNSGEDTYEVLVTANRFDPIGNEKANAGCVTDREKDVIRLNRVFNQDITWKRTIPSTWGYGFDGPYETFNFNQSVRTYRALGQGAIKAFPCPWLYFNEDVDLTDYITFSDQFGSGGDQLENKTHYGFDRDPDTTYELSPTDGQQIPVFFNLANMKLKYFTEGPELKIKIPLGEKKPEPFKRDILFYSDLTSINTVVDQSIKDAEGDLRWSVIAGLTGVSKFIGKKASDMIYVVRAVENGDPKTSVFEARFRDKKSRNYIPVGDTSPLGEVFVIAPDGSYMVHENFSGNIPRVQLPPGIFIVDAIWL